MHKAMAESKHLRDLIDTPALRVFMVARGQGYRGDNAFGPYIYKGVIRAADRQAALAKAEARWGAGRPYILRDVTP